jgi:hypothetical protein
VELRGIGEAGLKMRTGQIEECQERKRDTVELKPDGDGGMKKKGTGQIGE